MLPASVTHILVRGQSLVLHLPRGARIVCLQGTVTVHNMPQWLGEQLVQSRQSVADGSVYYAGDGGWTTVEASTTTRVEVLATADGPAAAMCSLMWEKLRRLLRRRTASVH